MAGTCQICKKKIAFYDFDYKTQGMSMHYECKKEFLEDSKNYGGQTPRELEDNTGKQKVRVETKEEESKGMVLTDINLPFGRVFWVTVQFFVAGLLIVIPLTFIIMIWIEESH